MKRMKRCLLVFLVFLLLTGCSPSLELPMLTVPTETEEKGTTMEYADPRLDEEMNVILLGNSNCYYWTDELYGMLAAEGYRNVNICNVYYSGCTFQKHWEWLRTDEAKYQFFICNERGRNVRNNVSLRTCLSYKNWDAVFLVATNSRQVYEGEEQEFEKGIRTYLPKVLEFLKERAPKADYFGNRFGRRGSEDVRKPWRIKSRLRQFSAAFHLVCRRIFS